MLKKMRCLENLPLSGPLQEVVRGNQRRNPVEDLTLGAAEGVENGIVESSPHGVLSVGRDTVVNNALLLGAAYIVELVPRLL